MHLPLATLNPTESWAYVAIKKNKRIKPKSKSQSLWFCCYDSDCLISELDTWENLPMNGKMSVFPRQVAFSCIKMCKEKCKSHRSHHDPIEGQQLRHSPGKLKLQLNWISCTDLDMLPLHTSRPGLRNLASVAPRVTTAACDCRALSRVAGYTALNAKLLM